MQPNAASLLTSNKKLAARPTGLKAFKDALESWFEQNSKFHMDTYYELWSAHNKIVAEKFLHTGFKQEV